MAFFVQYDFFMTSFDFFMTSFDNNNAKASPKTGAGSCCCLVIQGKENTNQWGDQNSQ
jgi:hypothetical protein